MLTSSSFLKRGSDERIKNFKHTHNRKIKSMTSHEKNAEDKLLQTHLLEKMLFVKICIFLKKQKCKINWVKLVKI